MCGMPEAADPAADMRLGHVAVSVTDIERSAAFYREVFGFDLAERHKIFQASLMIVIMKRPGIAVELFQFDAMKPLPDYRRSLDSDLRTVGVKHFSLEVDDVPGMMKMVRERGVECETEVREFADGRRYFFIKDPDGNLVEVMEKEKIA